MKSVLDHTELVKEDKYQSAGGDETIDIGGQSFKKVGGDSIINAGGNQYLQAGSLVAVNAPFLTFSENLVGPTAVIDDITSMFIKTASLDVTGAAIVGLIEGTCLFALDIATDVAGAFSYTTLQNSLKIEGGVFKPQVPVESEHPIATPTAIINGTEFTIFVDLLATPTKIPCYKDGSNWYRFKDDTLYVPPP